MTRICDRQIHNFRYFPQALSNTKELLLFKKNLPICIISSLPFAYRIDGNQIRFSNAGRFIEIFFRKLSSLWVFKRIGSASTNHDSQALRGRMCCLLSATSFFIGCMLRRKKGEWERKV